MPTSKPLLPIAELSERSLVMLGLRESVIDLWEQRLRQQVPGAQKLSRPVLVNTIPILFERMCMALTPRYFDPDGVDVASMGTEHGVERAAQTDFEPRAVLAEYQIFRSTVFDVLDAEPVPLTNIERRALNMTVDSAVRESIGAFVVATNQMREKLAGALAHDLRQPVSNISMAAQLIIRQGPAPDTADWAHRILKNSERMLAMLGEMLDALAVKSSARSKLDIEEFDLLELVGEVAAHAREYQGAHLNLSGQSTVGFWGRTALERALENIVNNAIKYGTPGAPISMSVVENDERATVSVSNQGKPIPREEFECIFQQFFRSSKTGETSTASWGVGLPYVREVAESHGGSVLVFSNADSGTTFSIDLPLDARPFQV